MSEERSWLEEAQFLVRIIKGGYGPGLAALKEPQSETEAVETLGQLMETLTWLSVRVSNLHDMLEMQLHARWQREAGRPIIKRL